MAADRVAVFGGSGFLGSHIADALSEAGHEVVIFDQRPSPYLRADQEMVVGDLLDQKAVHDVVAGCRWVYHFAALADIGEASERPRDTALINVVGTVNVLEAAKDAGVERFVFASTIYVHSTAGGFYRVSKQACERYIEEYQARYGLDYTILRFGSLYGRRADQHNTIHRLCHQAMTKRHLGYTGDGMEQREYIHAADAAKASLSILGDEFANQRITLTGTQSMRVRDVMQMIAEMLPFPVELQFGEGHAEGHYRSTPYAFAPRVGLKLTVNPFVDFGQGVLDCIHQLAEQGVLDDEG